MKKTITMLAMTLALSVQAEESRFEYCENLSGLASSIMNAHQKGVAMSAVMNAIGETATTRTMIQMAYDEPRYSSPEYQTQEREKFRDYIYGLCLESLTEK